MDNVRFSLPDCFSVREAVEKKIGGQYGKRDALLSLRPSQVLYYICLQQKLICEISFSTRYRCVTETWLPWTAAMWWSNGANDVCSSFNFASTSLWVEQGQRKQIRLLHWLGSQLFDRDTNFTGNGRRRFPAVISAQIDLTEDQIILLDLVTPSTNSDLSSPRTWWILEAMTIWSLCQLSFTIDSVKMLKNWRDNVIFWSLNKWNFNRKTRVNGNTHA